MTNTRITLMEDYIDYENSKYYLGFSRFIDSSKGIEINIPQEYADKIHLILNYPVQQSEFTSYLSFHQLITTSHTSWDFIHLSKISPLPVFDLIGINLITNENIKMPLTPIQFAYLYKHLEIHIDCDVELLIDSSIIQSRIEKSKLTTATILSTANVIYSKSDKYKNMFQPTFETWLKEVSKNSYFTSMKDVYSMITSYNNNNRDFQLPNSFDDFLDKM